MAREPAIPGPLGRPHPEFHITLRRNLEPLTRLVVAALPRLLDVLLSAFCLALLAPFFVIRMLYARLHYGRSFERLPATGRYRASYGRLVFLGPEFGRSWPLLINILRGDMSFVGPVSGSEPECREPREAEDLRFDQRPGLISPYAIRRKVGIAYEGQRQVEREHYYSETATGNLALLGRSLISSVLSGDSSLRTPDDIDFFGVKVVNTSMDEAVEWLIDRARNAVPSLVAFVNPDCLNIAYRDTAYRHVLEQASRVLPDGIGLRLGCRLFGVSLKENVNGTDLFPRLCERAAASNLPIFLLGARPGIAELASENLIKRFPALRVVGTQHGYFSSDDETGLIQTINASGARILIVAFGAPRQELWLSRHHAELLTPVRIGVGGLLDFYSGRIPRAPQWMREIGLEWAFRLAQEPGRLWRRYVIGNPLFLYRVWLQSRSMP